VYGGNSLPTFRDNLSVLSWPLKMGTICCPETSVRNYHHTLRNFPEERRSHLLRGGSPQSNNCSYCQFGRHFNYRVRKIKGELGSKYHDSHAIQLLRKTNSIHQNSSLATYSLISMDMGQYFLHM
jgi:hypothetical protein